MSNFGNWLSSIMQDPIGNLMTPWGTTSPENTPPGKERAAQAEAANQRNQAAMQELKDSQVKASSQAQAALVSRQRARASSQTIFTNPLGITGQANLAKKTLLGQ